MPAGEAFVELVPVADLLLSDLPAEQHLTSVAQSREVDQPPVEVFHLPPQLMDALQAAGYLGRLDFDLRLELGKRLRSNASAVPTDHLLQALPPVESLHETAAMLDQSLRKRAQRG